MGKKDKGPKSGVLPQREIFQRMNFLYQASRILLESDNKDNNNNNNNAFEMFGPLARFYTKEMKQISRKNVIRISPHIKRSICKVCSSPLIPGISSVNRVKKNKKNKGQVKVHIKCRYCHNEKSLLSNPKHVLFVDKEEHGTIN